MYIERRKSDCISVIQNVIDMEIRDVLGIEPIGQAGLELTRSAISGVSSFLSCVFKPGLEEIGYMARDEVRMWRLNNILRMLEKAKGKMCYDGQELNLTANARVGISIMENCSDVEQEELQDMWAGLFVSSCTSDGRDDSNMNFVDLLRRMSSVEAKILDYACKNSRKIFFPNKLILAEELIIPYSRLVEISEIDDIYRLDCELDHMRSIELIAAGGGFSNGAGFSATDEHLDADITPSALALNLYLRTHSAGISPISFWGDSISPYDVNLNKENNQ